MKASDTLTQHKRLFDLYICVGVELSVPEYVSVVEGEEQQFCVRIENYYIQRERDVMVDFSSDDFAICK